MFPSVTSHQLDGSGQPYILPVQGGGASASNGPARIEGGQRQSSTPQGVSSQALVPAAPVYQSDGTVTQPWIFNQHNSKAVTRTASYDRPPTLEELGIRSYFGANGSQNGNGADVGDDGQRAALRPAPYRPAQVEELESGVDSGGRQPWVTTEAREEVEGGTYYQR